MYISILDFKHVCMCVTEVGWMVRGGTRLVTHDLCTYYTLCMCVTKSGAKSGTTSCGNWSGCKQGAAAEVDANREQLLKWMQSGSSCWSGCNQGAAAEVDAIREQLLNWTQLGSSCWSGHNWGELGLATRE